MNETFEEWTKTQVLEDMLIMTHEQRMFVIRGIASQYCLECGSDVDAEPCSCREFGT